MSLPFSPITRCPGCGAELPPLDGPVHRYIESSPACWAAYGEVLAREYSDPAYMQVHRLTVDAYAAQHPGRPSPQSIQSVAVHLVALCAALELGMRQDAVTALIGRCVARRRFEWLAPAPRSYGLTVASVLAAGTAERHSAAVRAWAVAVWEAWAPHHARVRAWARAAIAE